MKIVSPLLMAFDGTRTFMPCPVLNKRGIRTALKGESNEARLHPMWRHYNPDSLGSQLDDALHLIEVE